LGKGEYDFVVKQGFDINEAIQVTYNLNIENYSREINGLLEVMKEYNLKEGLLITLNLGIDISALPKGINLMPIWKWLFKAMH